MILRLGALTILFAAMFSAFAEPQATPSSGGSGIEGVVNVSPSRPGPIHKGDSSSAPAPNVEFVVKRGDERVTTFSTDSEGRFRVSLPPGHYVVLRQDPGAGIRHWRFEADVSEGRFTSVSWTGDSGMR